MTVALITSIYGDYDDLVDCTSMAVLLTAEGVEDFWRQHQQRMQALVW